MSRFKQVLIFLYLIPFVGLFVYSTIGDLAEREPVWYTFLDTVFPALAVLSLVCYASGIPPKRSIWFWRCVPFAFVAFEIWDMFYSGGAIFFFGNPIIALALWAFLYPAIYVSFRFAFPSYSHTPREKTLKIYLFPRSKRERGETLVRSFIYFPIGTIIPMAVADYGHGYWPGVFQNLDWALDFFFSSGKSGTPGRWILMLCGVMGFFVANKVPECGNGIRRCYRRSETDPGTAKKWTHLDAKRYSDRPGMRRVVECL